MCKSYFIGFQRSPLLICSPPYDHETMKAHKLPLSHLVWSKYIGQKTGTWGCAIDDWLGQLPLIQLQIWGWGAISPIRSLPPAESEPTPVHSTDHHRAARWSTLEHIGARYRGWYEAECKWQSAEHVMRAEHRGPHGFRSHCSSCWWKSWQSIGTLEMEWWSWAKKKGLLVME